MKRLPVRFLFAVSTILILILNNLATLTTAEAQESIFLKLEHGVLNIGGGSTDISQAHLGQSSQQNSSIRMVPGTVELEAELESAVVQALPESPTALSSATAFAFTDVTTYGRWKFISVIGLVGIGESQNWNLERNGNWFGLVIAERIDSSSWEAAVEGTLQFSELLSHVPNSYLSTRAKDDIDPIVRASRSANSSYVFPWESGKSMQYGALGVHDNEFPTVVPGWKAVDFLSDGNTGAGHAPNSLKAAAGGTISYKCSPAAGQYTAAVRINDLMYAHLNNSGSLDIGRSFNQRDEIGSLKTGDFNEKCGYADQNSNTFHVHWGFPNTGSLQVEGWTLSFSDGLWRRGGETRGTGSWLVAGSGGDKCPGPSLISPSPNAVLSNRNVTFSWNSISGCTYQGYTFRVCISSDIGNLSNCQGTGLKDIGVGGTSYSYEITGRDKTDLWWGVRAANAPNGADWSEARKFRIDPDVTPTGTWKADFYESKERWDDPNNPKDYRCSRDIASANGGFLDWRPANGTGGSECGMRTDNWVADFSRKINFPAGEYVFYIDHDDGMRLWINGQEVRGTRGRQENEVVCEGDGTGYYLSGEKTIRALLVEDSGDAFAKVRWDQNNGSCPKPPPTANFDAWPLSGPAPFTVKFHDTSQGNYNTCLWEYGDGTSSSTCGGSGSYHDHVYSNPGTYSPKLTVTGPGGPNSKTIQNYIVVEAGTPPAPTLVSPANNSTFVEGASITLSWNSSSGATEYFGEYTSTAGNNPFGWQSGTNKAIGAQPPGYEYSWRVKAKNSGGESTYSPPWKFTVIPKAPSNASTSELTCNSVKVSWTDNSQSATSFRIYRNGSEIASVSANITSYTDQPLQEKTDYNYTVRAVQNNITSNASNTASITTPKCEELKPDLVPFAPSGYQYPVVPAAIKGTKTAGPLFAGKVVHLDWFFKNIGNADTPTGFQIELWIDGERKIQYPWPYSLGAGYYDGFIDWSDNNPLTPGMHTIKLIVDPTNQIAESNENNNVWERAFEWKPVNGWWAEFFNNKTLTGDPVLVRDDAAINFAWHADSPGPGVNADNFSARWTRKVNFDGGNYRFTVMRDDGARLFIDGKSVWSKWEYGAETVTFDLAVSAGQHDLVFEMYEIDGSSQAGLSWIKLADDACAAPVLLSPAAAAVLNNRTITFSWNPVTGCQFNGYTFRVCTSSDVGNLANCFIDTGVSGTQTTQTITGRDNKELYWGVRAANATNGANWISRKFRIEIDCSPNADQVALYADPGFGGQCVTLSVGNYNNLSFFEGLNDTVSSLKVGQNVRVKLCEHSSGGGTCQWFASNNSDLAGSGLNDNASSAYVETKPTSNTTMSITPATQTVPLGSQFCVNLAVAQVTNLGAFEFTLEFPPATLKAESANIGAFLGSSGRTVVPVNPTINNTTGKVTYGAASLGNNIPGPNGGGNLAQVCFTPKKEGTASLTLTKGVLTNVPGTAIPATLQNGSVTISSCYWADVNCDGAVSIIDIQLVAARWGTELGDPQYDPAYDIDDNDKIDIIDIQMVAGQWGWPGRSLAAAGAIDQTDGTEAADAFTFSLNPSSLNLAPGETKTFDLRVAGADDLAAFETTIDFNPALLKVNGVTLGSFLGSTGRTVIPVGPAIDNTAGKVTYGAATLGNTPPGPNGSGVLATFSVTALAPGSGTLDMHDSIATDTVPESIPVTETDGAFQVSGGGLSAPVLNDIDNPDGDGNFPVSWPAVGGATGYTLQERFNGGGWSEIYDGPNTSVNRTNRNDGEWCYRVRAYDNSDDSNWSAIECTTVSTTVEPPEAPVLDEIANPGQQSSFAVEWNAVQNATGYTLQERYENSNWLEIYDGPNTSVNRTNRNDGEWCYRVRAYNNVDDSNWSAIECTTVITAVDPPEAPVLDGIYNPGQESSYWVEWFAVDNATGYTLQERFNGGSWSDIYDGPSNGVNRTNRSNGEWCYRVRAYNNGGDSDWSGFECTTVADTIDTIQPTVNWLSPVSNEETYFTSANQMVQLRVQATDNVGVDYVAFSRYDAVLDEWITIGEDSTSPYQITLDVDTLRNGYNQINAWAFDAASNVGTKYIWVYLDSTPSGGNFIFVPTIVR